MSGNKSVTIWMKRLVIAVCIGVVMLSASIVSVRLGLTGAAEAALLAFFACVTVIFFVRQFALRREIEAAKDMAYETASTPVWSKASKSGGFERVGHEETGADAFSLNDFPVEKSEPVAPKKEVASALGKDDLILFLQPIVTLPDKEPAFYQTLLRLKMSNGILLDPLQYRQIAHAGGLMAGIDRRNVTQSIRMLKTLNAMQKKAGLFCSLSQDSIKNGKGYDRVVKLLENNISLAGDLIVEVNQEDYGRLGSAGRNRLQAIANLGYQLCLAGVIDLKIDLDALRNSGFAYIKIPASMLIHGQSDGGAIYPETLAAHVALRDMRLIATDVSREQDVPLLMDRDALLAQGDLFAEPKQVRAELLDED